MSGMGRVLTPGQMSQTRCRRCLEWNNGDPWVCPKCGKETTMTPHDGGALGDAAEWERYV